VNTEPKPDMVNGPKHYRGDRVMCIIEEFGLGFKDGNVIKYVLRYPEKGGVEDLKKARWYLDRLIAEKEGVVEVKPVDPPEDEFDSLKPGDTIVYLGRERKVLDVIPEKGILRYSFDGMTFGIYKHEYKQWGWEKKEPHAEATT